MQSEDELPDDFPKIKPKRRAEYIQPRRSRIRWLLVAAVGVVIVLPMVVGQYTTWLWFQQLGYQTVFTTTLFTKAALGASVGLITAAIIWLNLKLALRLSPETSHIARHFVIQDQEIPAPN